MAHDFNTPFQNLLSPRRRGSGPKGGTARRIGKRFGEDAIHRNALAYSDNIFPYLIKVTAQETFGESYTALWEQWKRTLIDQYHKEQSQLQEEGLTQSAPLTTRTGETLGAKVNPVFGQIAYSSATAYDYRSLRSLDGTKDSRLALRNSGYTMSWSPDGTAIIFFSNGGG